MLATTLNAALCLSFSFTLVTSIVSHGKTFSPNFRNFQNFIYFALVLMVQFSNDFSLFAPDPCLLDVISMLRVAYRHENWMCECHMRLLVVNIGVNAKRPAMMTTAAATVMSATATTTVVTYLIRKTKCLPLNAVSFDVSRVHSRTTPSEKLYICV